MKKFIFLSFFVFVSLYSNNKPPYKMMRVEKDLIEREQDYSVRWEWNHNLSDNEEFYLYIKGISPIKVEGIDEDNIKIVAKKNVLFGYTIRKTDVFKYNMKDIKTEICRGGNYLKLKMKFPNENWENVDKIWNYPHSFHLSPSFNVDILMNKNSNLKILCAGDLEINNVKGDIYVKSKGGINCAVDTITENQSVNLYTDKGDIVLLTDAPIRNIYVFTKKGKVSSFFEIDTLKVKEKEAKVVLVSKYGNIYIKKINE